MGCALDWLFVRLTTELEKVKKDVTMRVLMSGRTYDTFWLGRFHSARSQVSSHVPKTPPGKRTSTSCQIACGRHAYSALHLA